MDAHPETPVFPMKTLAAAWLVIVSTLLCACGGPAGNDYFPLDAGWQWRYDIHVTTMDGPQYKKYLVENLGEATHEGRKLSMRSSADGAVTYYQPTADGILRVGESRPEQGTTMFEAPSPVLPATLEKGARWSQAEYTVTLEHTGPPEHSLNRITVPVDVHYIVEETNDTVQLPMGTFTNCIRVRGKGATSKNVGFYVGQTDIGVDNTAWYAPGVGLVKATRIETTTSRVLPRGSYEMTLNHFERR
jgi:hypothetical protein